MRNDGEVPSYNYEITKRAIKLWHLETISRYSGKEINAHLMNTAVLSNYQLRGSMSKGRVIIAGVYE